MSENREPTASKRGRLWVWVATVSAFYVAWVAFVTFAGLFPTVVAHWPIAAAMAAGSYFAGATPMGGGTVGFPVLVLLFDQSASMGRDFSFAVQAVGMTSAAIFIFATRQPLEWGTLKWAMLGSAIGTPLGIAFVAPYAPDLLIKLLFAVVWASFGLMHLLKLREFCAAEGITRTDPAFDRRMGLTVGFGAGLLVASVTGVGIDMVIYSVLVLVVRADLKVAVPTSVVLMAFTSIVGIGSTAALQHFDPGAYRIDPEVFDHWIAAAPVVALGAPLGAYVVNLVDRTFTLALVALLCIGQFFWTLVHERAQMTGVYYALAAGGIVAFSLVFRGLYRLGGTMSRRPGFGRAGRFEDPIEPLVVPLPSPRTDS